MSSVGNIAPFFTNYPGSASSGSPSPFFVDLFNAQTVAGAKTWTGAQVMPTLAVTSATNPQLIVGSTGSNGAGGISFRRASDGALGASIGYPTAADSANLQIQSAGGSGIITFWTNTVEKMRLVQAGLLGIGTTAPTASVHILGGGLNVKALATAATPTITQTGVTGAVSYWYWVVPLDRAGNQGTMSLAGTTTTANATLDTNNFETITWTATTGAASYDVLRTTSSTAPTGTVSVKVGNTTALTLNDQSNTPTSYTVNTGNTANAVVDGLFTANKVISTLSATIGGANSNNDLVITTAGKGLQVKSGSNARISTAAGSAMVAGSLTVSNTSFTANTVLLWSIKTVGGTPGTVSYVVTAGTGAVFTSTSGTDTSTIVWMAVEAN